MINSKIIIIQIKTQGKMHRRTFNKHRVGILGLYTGVWEVASLLFTGIQDHKVTQHCVGAEPTFSQVKQTLECIHNRKNTNRIFLLGVRKKFEWPKRIREGEPLMVKS